VSLVERVGRLFSTAPFPTTTPGFAVSPPPAGRSPQTALPIAPSTAPSFPRTAHRPKLGEVAIVISPDIQICKVLCISRRPFLWQDAASCHLVVLSITSISSSVNPYSSYTSASICRSVASSVRQAHARLGAGDLLVPANFPAHSPRFQANESQCVVPSKRIAERLVGRPYALKSNICILTIPDEPPTMPRLRQSPLHLGLLLRSWLSAVCDTPHNRVSDDHILHPLREMRS